MPDSKVIKLHGAGQAPADERHDDDALAEERRTAVEIVAGVRGGDAASEVQLVERYSRGLRFLIMRRIGDDERARDLLQDTFAIAFEKLRTTDIEQPERLAGYLRGIAVRVAMNAIRKRYREPTPIDVDEIAAVPDTTPRPFEQVSEGECAAAVRELITKLKVPRDREILTRFYLDEQDKDDICRALNLNSLHFNRVLFRAKARFREIMEQSGMPGG